MKTRTIRQWANRIALVGSSSSLVILTYVTDPGTNS